MNNITFASRLKLGFALLLALMCGMAGFAAWQMSHLADNSAYYAANLIPSYEVEHGVGLDLADMRRFELRHVLSNTEAGMDELETKIAERRKTIATGLDKYAKEFVSDEEDRRSLDQVKLAVTAYMAEWEKVRPVSRKTLSDPTQSEAATKLLLGESSKRYDLAQAAVQAWWNYNTKLAQGQNLASSSTYATAKATLIALTVLSMALGIVSAFLIIRSVTRTLGGDPAALSGVIRRVADGDLSTRIDVKAGDDTSVMAAAARMQAYLQGVVSSVRQNSESVATASAQIAQGNQDLSARTEQQASALQQTAATMEELGTTVRNNVDSAKQANQLARSASSVAAQGGTVVGQVVTTMQGINESSRKIGDIISVIDGIAFQTNILALNAAVEAARAGEQGRGFAVVASEVRSLAQRSAEAAKEIKGLIGRSVEQVEQGTALVDQAGKTMGEIVSSTQRVSDIVAEITSASVEQSSGVQQVGEAVSQMDQATQQNAALVEESAAAAESLKGQAQQLVQAVAVFKLQHETPVSAAYIAVPAANAASGERRGPDRAKNVARATFTPKPAAPAAHRATTVTEKTGSDDWASF